MKKPLVISILAKSCAHMLPLYLKSLMHQSEVDRRTIFYIRTNDNRDSTAEILRDWYLKWNWKWKMVFDDSSINLNLLTKHNHEWDYERFEIISKIRQDSVEFAKSEGADYWVQDCDNIVLPDTIESLRSLNLPVVTPYMQLASMNSKYSNYHTAIDENGYFEWNPVYDQIWNREIKGVFEVPVVHCSYFIQNQYLDSVNYNDGSGRYEYVIFSDVLRKANIPQYIDNRKVYGSLFFAANREEMKEELKTEYTKQLLSIYN